MNAIVTMPAQQKKERIVSIVMPVKNGQEYLTDVLESIFSQHTPFLLDVIVIDSGSTDGSLDILRAYPVRIMTCPPLEFNHGETRNRAAREARGDVVVFMNQDATFATDTSLATLIRELDEHRACAVYARHFPRGNHNLLRKLEIQRSFPLQGKNDEISGDVFQLSPRSLYRLCRFNTVCGAIRKDYFDAHPFATIDFGEDVEWAKRALLDRQKTTYVPAAEVIHSHDFYRSFRATYELNYDDALFVKNTFGKCLPVRFYTVPFVWLYLCLRDCVRVAGTDAPFAEKLEALLLSPKARFAQVLGIFAGYNSSYLPRTMRKKFSSVERKKNT